MVDWKALKIGDRIVLKRMELGVRLYVPCTVTEIYEDHLIIFADDGYKMWLDEDFADMFYRLRK